MHILFLNPQGNFDKNDTHLAQHPDLGGQIVYVQEICKSLVKLGVTVDIVTRQIDDERFPEYKKQIDYLGASEDKLRIVRLKCGPKGFLEKEQLWHHLEEWTDNIIEFYKDNPPDFATGHYGDGGYACALFKAKTGIGYSFTGHSLGAQKLDKFGMTLDNFDQMDGKYNFSKRIMAERCSMEFANRIITSTSQERFEQYSHDLYKNAVNVNDDTKFSVIPPGVNLEVFNTTPTEDDRDFFKEIERQIGSVSKPCIIASSRFDEKKNHIGIIKAFALSKELQDLANIVIIVRGFQNPYEELDKLPPKERGIMEEMLSVITENGLKEKVLFLEVTSQKKLAAAYKYFAKKKSVFTLTAFYEPFGLAPIEAAASGLAAVATKNGGPTEIFKDQAGVLVDPFDTADIAAGLIEGVKKYDFYAPRGIKRVLDTYTWDRTAEGYLAAIKEEAKKNGKKELSIAGLEGKDLIRDFLSKNKK